jgi:hypothetical protein
LAQLVLGVYLKLHIHERTLRPYAVLAHGVLGKSYPIWGWVQMLFGAIVLGGYCEGGHINQCLAHYIMVRRFDPSRLLALTATQGSGFIGYGAIMAIMFVAGESWVRRHGRAPEFYDSAVITVWVSGLSAFLASPLTIMALGNWWAALLATSHGYLLLL